MNLFANVHMQVNPVAVTYDDPDGPTCRIYREASEALDYFINNDLWEHNGAIWREDGSVVLLPVKSVGEVVT